MRDLREIRQELDQVDREMVRLFEKRMNLALEVAQYKTAHGMPVLDASREEQVLASRAAMLQSPRLDLANADAVSAADGPEPRRPGGLDEGGG